MPDARTCPVCGAALPPDAPKGFCPRCLYRAGLDETPPSELEDDSTLPSVRDFGDYELLEEIGHGGMGMVYKARQKSLDRIVALKLLLFGPHAPPESVKRFRAEAVATAALQHPNIVAIHEVGFCDGQHFIAMDFIEGRSLAKVISDFGFRISDFRRAAGYVKTIAEAIHYAHEHGILHRDLKPSNVLIDANDQPRVTDFGLAKRLEGDSKLTVSGQVLGSPNYMPPEQATGKRGTLSRRSDVYALGAILYHALTSRPPFVGEGLGETVQQVLNVEPLSPRVLNPSVPDDLETVCLKCLEKEPAKRYATALMVAEELGRWLEGKSVLARPVGPAGKVWRWCRRNPRLAWAVGIAALSLLIGLAGVTWQWRRAEAERARAEAGELSARQNAYASDMLLAQHALALNNTRLAESLLGKYRPGGKSEIRNPKSEMDLRGWEWRYLWQLCQPDASIRLQTESPPTGPAFISQDGRVLAVRNGRDQIEVWDLTTRRQRTALSGFDTCTILGLSANGGLLAVRRGQAPTLEVWNLASGMLNATLSHPALPKSLAFSPDGRLLATLDHHSTNMIISIVDWAANRSIASFTAPPTRQSFAGEVAFSPDGSRLATGLDFGMIRILDWQSGDLVTITNLAETDETVRALVFSPNGELLASGLGYTEGTIRLWDTHSRALRRELPHRIARITRLAFSPDGQRLASVSVNRTISIWSVADLTEQRRFRGPDSEGSALAFLPDSTTLATGCETGGVFFWDATETNRDPAHASLRISAGFASPAHVDAKNFAPGVLDPGIVRRCGFAFTPDGRHFITSDPEGWLGVWETKTLRQTERLAELGGGHCGVALSPDGRWLATGHDSGRVTFWDWARRRRVDSHEIPFEWFGLVWFSDSGRFLLANSILNDHSGRLRIWRTGDWQAVPLRPDQTAGFKSASLSPDDWLLAMGYGNGAVKLWSFPEGRLEAAFTNRQGYVCAVRFSPDGRVLASASLNGEVKLWDVPARRESAILPGHLGEAWGAAFSPNGRRLATGSDSARDAVKLWDLATGRELLTLSGEGEYFLGVAFSPDGGTLTATSFGGVAHLWRAPSWEEIAAAEKSEVTP